MSKMVFAITGRGKTQGKSTGRIEVGSWVIGFWRPELHFEINVWECFERRAVKLLNALTTVDPLRNFEISDFPEQVFTGQASEMCIRDSLQGHLNCTVVRQVAGTNNCPARLL